MDMVNEVPFVKETSQCEILSTFVETFFEKYKMLKRRSYLKAPYLSITKLNLSGPKCMIESVFL